jgi:dipeptide/tripeptide permease
MGRPIANSSITRRILTFLRTPNDLLNNLNPIGIIIMIPILDQVFYPLLRRFKINFSPLKRMTAGFFVACIAMVWAAVVQSQIYAKGMASNGGFEATGRANFIQGLVDTI